MLKIIAANFKEKKEKDKLDNNKQVLMADIKDACA